MTAERFDDPLAGLFLPSVRTGDERDDRIVRAVSADAILRSDVESHQRGHALVLFVVELVVLVLKFLLVMSSAVRIVGVIRFDECLEGLLVFIDHTADGQIRGDLHDRRVDPVFVFCVIVV